MPKSTAKATSTPEPKRPGNPSSLVEHKENSRKTTRQALDAALARIQVGKPVHVRVGSAISAVAIAKEAGIDRSTLYRYHGDFLDEIRKLTDSTSQQLLESKRSELTRVQSRAREYRTLAEDLQAELEAVARHNYALSHRVQELEELIRQRDAVIVDLQQRMSDREKVVKMHLV